MKDFTMAAAGGRSMSSSSSSSSPLSSSSIYAFVGWVASIMSYIIFLMWSFLPVDVLHSFGITYYPSKYSALVIPSYIMVCIFCALLAYIGYNMMNTFDPEDLRTTAAFNKSTGRVDSRGFFNYNLNYDKNLHQDATDSTPCAQPYFIKVGKRAGIPEPGDIDDLHRSYYLANNWRRKYSSDR